MDSPGSRKKARDDVLNDTHRSSNSNSDSPSSSLFTLKISSPTGPSVGSAGSKTENSFQFKPLNMDSSSLNDRKTSSPLQSPTHKRKHSDSPTSFANMTVAFVQSLPSAQLTSSSDKGKSPSPPRDEPMPSFPNSTSSPSSSAPSRPGLLDTPVSQQSHSSTAVSVSSNASTQSLPSDASPPHTSPCATTTVTTTTTSNTTSSSVTTAATATDVIDPSTPPLIPRVLSLPGSPASGAAGHRRSMSAHSNASNYSNCSNLENLHAGEISPSSLIDSRYGRRLRSPGSPFHATALTFGSTTTARDAAPTTARGGADVNAEGSAAAKPRYASGVATITGLGRRSPSASPSASPTRASPRHRRTGSGSKLNFSAGLHYRSKSSESATTLFKTGESSSGASQLLYSDRFIPSRSGSNLESALSPIDVVDSSKKENASTGAAAASESKNEAGDSTAITYSLLLRNEILGLGPQTHNSSADPSASSTPPSGGSSPHKPASSTRNRMALTRTFRFHSPKKDKPGESPYSLSPVGAESQRLLASPRKHVRKIAKSPFKVLDAPSLKDDFYLNLVDWSAQNVLAVGLGSCVYLWSACTSKVTKLCDLEESNCVTSVSWSLRGTHLAVGTRTGLIQLWDVAKGKMVRTMGGHIARVGTVAWTSHCLASGSRDRTIFLRDVRSQESYTRKLVGHKQEVCGLKWSFDESQLASGGNDNKLLIWNAHNSTPMIKFAEHTAAVKAIAWSPHQNGLLASGGGTADRCIRFWNTLTSSSTSCVDTGSQVCNLMWSKNVNEIVSTHGYSLNQIIVWKYPAMQSIATLTGHTYRVLYLAMSPDGQTVVTGAGDETLRFWNVFPSSKSKNGGRFGNKLFFPSSSEIR